MVLTTLDELLQVKQEGPRVAYITDVHLRARAPRWRSDNFLATTIDKIQWVLQAAKQLGCEPTILCGGDLFDVPQPPLYVGDDLLDLLGEEAMGMATVFGNHDLESSLTTAMRTLLGHLMRRKLLRILPPLTDGSTPFMLGGMAIWGHHYRYGNHQDLLDAPLTLPGIPRVIVSHSQIVKEAPAGLPDYTLFHDIQTNVELLLLGHIHIQQELTVLDNAYRTIVAAPGALTRGTLSRDDLQREPAMVLIENGSQLRVWYVKVGCARPASEVFYLDQALEEKERLGSLEEFVGELDNLKGQALDIASIIERISAAEGIEPAVRTEALRRLGVL